MGDWTHQINDSVARSEAHLRKAFAVVVIG